MCAQSYLALFSFKDCQASLSKGFPRQEYWSGLPFLSPMHESEKWKWSHSVSRVRLLATPWTAAQQAPPSMGFSRQEYRSGVPLPSPWDLSDPGIEPKSPALAGRFFNTESPRKPQSLVILRSKWLRLPGSIQCLCPEFHQVTCENSPSSFYLKFLSHDFNHKIDNSQINIEEWSQWPKRFSYFFKELIWWQITLVVQDWGVSQVIGPKPGQSWADQHDCL